jgi:hypothetical protein
MRSDKRSDKLLVIMINFLIPFILLYAVFALVDYVNSGFFALLYATIIFVIAFLIYSVKFVDLKLSSIISVKLISWIGLLIAIIYLSIILLLLIDLMPEIRI